MEGFGVVDYVVCVVTVVGSGAVGLASSIWGKKDSFQDRNTVTRNMMVDRSSSMLPIVCSLIMGVFTGSALLGAPGDIFINGAGSVYFVPWAFLNALINNYITLPIFYNLKLSSVYEYLGKRFDIRVRLLVSFLKLFHLTTRNTITLFATAIIFQQVSGVNTYAASAFTCILCAIYTIAGGFKAVIWSDTAQAAITAAGLMAVMVKGTMDVGGFTTVWQTNIEGERLNFLSLEVNLVMRFTIWAAAIAHPVFSIQPSSLAQDTVQRYLSLPTLRQAKQASWYYIIGHKLCWLITTYFGLVTYAIFHDCDPLATGQVKRPDELLALLVTKTLGGYPGLQGLFAAAVFSLCLSTFSTGLDTSGLIILEDFVKHKHPNVSNKTARRVVTATIVCASAISFGLIFLVEKTHLLFPLAASLGACSAGPIVAVFLGGMLLPWMNKQGALYGGIIGFCFTAVTVFGSQFSALRKEEPLVKRPTVDGCPLPFNISLPSPTSLITTAGAAAASVTDSYVFPLFKMSFNWFCLCGAIATIVPAMIISFFTGRTDLSRMDEMLLIPLARKVLPKKMDQEELKPMNRKMETEEKARDC